jgi:hypothetical protein
MPPKSSFPKKFLAFNVKLQKEMKTQAKEHPTLPRKYLAVISADHIKIMQKSKKIYN